MRRLSLLLLAGCLAAAGPEATELVARVTYIVPEGAYVDAGTDQGLREGQDGTVLRDGRPVAKAEVVAAAARSARLRVYDGEARPGDLVRFEVAETPQPAPAPVPGDEGAKRPEESGAFVPLLERQKAAARGTAPRNVSHGWVAVNQYLQTATDDSLDYWRTTLSSVGDIQRLWGKPWALDWSFTASARGGEQFDGSSLEGGRLDVYELALSRRMGEEGLLRLGRFVPSALPAAGYVDGFLYEQRLGDGLRGGAILGVKPTIDDLAPSLDEPTAVLYATIDAGKRGGSRFTGTFGVLGSLYDGDTDRLAALADLFAQVGEVQLGLDATVDFDAGSALFTTGTRLTELDAYASARVTRGTTLRAGADHHENPDTAAFRAGIPIVDPLLFEGSGWRYYGGLTQALGASFTIDAQVNYIDAPDTGETTTWLATLTRYGLLGSDVASMSLTVYSLEGLGVDGLGGLLSAYLPLRSNRLILQGSVGFRAFDPEGLDALDVTDVRLAASYLIAPRWTLQGGVSAAIGDAADNVGLDIGLQYRW